MINLIPNQEKKRKVKDFYFRLTAVFITVLGFCAAIAAASLLPVHFLSSAQLSIARGKLLALENEPTATQHQDLSAARADLERKLAMVETASESEYPVSRKIVNSVIARKMPDIKIMKLTYQSDPEGRKVIVYGRAPSRERLHLFRRALEDDVAFKKVELPISNFVKGSNIEFSITLIPRPDAE